MKHLKPSSVDGGAAMYRSTCRSDIFASRDGPSAAVRPRSTVRSLLNTGKDRRQFFSCAESDFERARGLTVAGIGVRLLLDVHIRAFEVTPGHGSGRDVEIPDIAPDDKCRVASA